MFIAANWKMNLNRVEIHDFVKGISDFKFNDNYKVLMTCSINFFAPFFINSKNI